MAKVPIYSDLFKPELGGVLLVTSKDPSPGLRIVLREHEHGFSKTLLRNVGVDKPRWDTLSHDEWLKGEKP